MQSLYDRIKDGIKCLPLKDRKICEKYLEERNFQSILEIAESDLIMKDADDLKETHQEKWENLDVANLEELIGNTKEYLSYMDIDLDNDYYDE